MDDRRRLIRDAGSSIVTSSYDNPRPTSRQTVHASALCASQVPIPTRTIYSGNHLNSHSSSNDGVFANLNAKPERGEKLEEQPPVSSFG